MDMGEDLLQSLMACVPHGWEMTTHRSIMTLSTTIELSAHTPSRATAPSVRIAHTVQVTDEMLVRLQSDELTIFVMDAMATMVSKMWEAIYDHMQGAEDKHRAAIEEIIGGFTSAELYEIAKRWTDTPIQSLVRGDMIALIMMGMTVKELEVLNGVRGRLGVETMRKEGRTRRRHKRAPEQREPGELLSQAKRKRVDVPKREGTE